MLVSGALALASAPAPAEAATPAGLELEWKGPDGCPDTAQVRALIDRLVGEPTGSMAGVSTQVRAVVSPVDEGYEVDLWARQGDAVDRRRFEASRCSALANATALVVAVALRPMAVAGTLGPPPVQKPTSVGEAEQPEVASADEVPPPSDSEAEAPKVSASRSGERRSEPSEEPPAEARARPRLRPRLGLGLSLGPGIGVLPSVSAELRGSVSVLLRRWRIGAFAMFWTPASSAVDPDAAVVSSIEARMVGGGIRGCHTWTRGRLEFPLCAGLAGGSMRGLGEGGTVQPRVVRSPWVAAEAGPGLGFSLGPRVTLGLSVDAIVAVARPGFDIRMGNTSIAIFRASPVGGRASLGVEVRLP